MGRPTKYKSAYCRTAAFLCALGATDDTLAAYFRVTEKTIIEWRAKHPKFLQSITKAKEDADNVIEKSLFQRAKGFVHEDTDIRAVAVGGGVSEIVKTPIIKTYPPDTGAAIFWLKNRRPKQWRDKQEVALQNADGSNLIPPEMIEAAAAVARLNQKKTEAEKL